MFEDFLLKDCKILLDVYKGSLQITNTVLIAQVLEIDDKLMKVKMLEDVNLKGPNKTKTFQMFEKDEEVYLNINHITAISINYAKV